jgi:hypothetical protein
MRFIFEASNLRLDSGELTLKSRNRPAHPRRPFRFRGFHNAPHVRSHAIAPPRRSARHWAGDDEAPPGFSFVERDYPDSGVLRLSGSQQNAQDFLTYVNVLPCVEWLEELGATCSFAAPSSLSLPFPKRRNLESRMTVLSMVFRASGHHPRVVRTAQAAAGPAPCLARALSRE